MKKVGIVVDNYKIEKYKEKLQEAGFTELEIIPFTAGTSTIKFDLLDVLVNLVKNICIELELGFKQSN